MSKRCAPCAKMRRSYSRVPQRSSLFVCSDPILQHVPPWTPAPSDASSTQAQSCRASTPERVAPARQRDSRSCNAQKSAPATASARPRTDFQARRSAAAARKKSVKSVPHNFLMLGRGFIAQTRLTWSRWICPRLMASSGVFMSSTYVACRLTYAPFASRSLRKRG